MESDKGKLISFENINRYSWHKGFYHDKDVKKSLREVEYMDFFEEINDEEFPYDTAEPLLCGSCHIFAMSLKKVLGYNPYIIEGINDKSYHAFCQTYKNGCWYYVDARGATSSFDEFMAVAREFVSDEYIIRQVTSVDLQKWENDRNRYDDEAYSFAEALIKKFKDFYVL